MTPEPCPWNSDGGRNQSPSMRARVVMETTVGSIFFTTSIAVCSSGSRRPCACTVYGPMWLRSNCVATMATMAPSRKKRICLLDFMRSPLCFVSLGLLYKIQLQVGEQCLDLAAFGVRKARFELRRQEPDGIDGDLRL